MFADRTADLYVFDRAVHVYLVPRLHACIWCCCWFAEAYLVGVLWSIFFFLFFYVDPAPFPLRLAPTRCCALLSPAPCASLPGFARCSHWRKPRDKEEKKKRGSISAPESGEAVILRLRSDGL